MVYYYQELPRLSLIFTQLFGFNPQYQKEEINMLCTPRQDSNKNT